MRANEDEGDRSEPEEKQTRPHPPHTASAILPPSPAGQFSNGDEAKREWKGLH